MNGQRKCTYTQRVLLFSHKEQQNQTIGGKWLQLEIMLSENTTDPKVCISPDYLSYIKSGMQRDHENRKVAIWEKDRKGPALGRG